MKQVKLTIYLEVLIQMSATLPGRLEETKQKEKWGMKKIALLIILLFVIAIGVLIFRLVIGDNSVSDWPVVLGSSK